MTDRPILFSGPMVRAILDGRKTQTRRAMKPQPSADMGLVGIYAPKLTAVFGYETPDSDHKVTLRYMPGDRLWVREHWRTESDYYNDLAPSEMGGEETILYAADADWSQNKSVGRYRQGMFMPRWASRITLTVADVRVQRLQEISEADAEAEGTAHCDVCGDVGWINSGPDGGWQCTAPGCGDGYIECFQRTWDDINAKRNDGAFAWSANPWVVALSFRVIKHNIDQIEEQAA